MLQIWYLTIFDNNEFMSQLALPILDKRWDILISRINFLKSYLVLSLSTDRIGEVVPDPHLAFN